MNIYGYTEKVLKKEKQYTKKIIKSQNEMKSYEAELKIEIQDKDKHK